MVLSRPEFENTAESYRNALMGACPEPNECLATMIIFDLKSRLSSALTCLQMLHVPDTSESDKSYLLKIVEDSVESIYVIVEGSNSYLSEIHKRTSDQSQIDPKDKNSAA